MACLEKIAANIVSDCSTIGVGGIEIKVWIYNRSEATLTYDVTNPSKITAIVFASTKRAWTGTGTKKLFDAGFSGVVNEKRPNKWKHKFNLETFSFAAADNENVSNMQDIVVIVESKDKGNDGTFRAYGVKAGLFPTSDEHMENTANAARTLVFESLPDQEEVYPVYIFDAGTYAQSAAALLAMETPAS